MNIRQCCFDLIVFSAEYSRGLCGRPAAVYGFRQARIVFTETASAGRQEVMKA